MGFLHLSRRPGRWGLVLGLLLGLPAGLGAQAPRAPISAMTLRFRITAVTPRADGTVEATLEAGLRAGIEEGMECDGTAVKVDSLGSRGGADVGSGRIIHSDSSASIALIRLTDPATPEKRLYAGDLVAIRLEERYSTHATLLTELVNRRISLTDDDGNSFYGFWKVLLQDDDSLANPAYAAMATDLHAVATRVLKGLSDTSSLRQPISAGYYRGRSLIDVLTRATPADVVRYLDYVTSWPAGYIGRDLALGPAFARWADGGALPGKFGVRDDLLAIPNDADRLRRIKELKDALSDGIWLGNWNRTAEAWAEAGRLEEARRLNLVALQVVEAYDITDRRGWVLFSQAQIESAARERAAAIAAFRRSIPAFQKASDEEGVRFALNNIANEMNRLGQYVQAVAIWDTVATLERARTRVDSSTAQHASLALTLLGYGRALEKIDRYADALAIYEESSRQYVLAGGLRADARRADLLNSMAGIYGKQGDRDKSIRTYREAQAIYHRLEDGEGEADQLDEIGHQTFQLGNYREAKEAWEEAYRLHMAAGEIGDAGYSKSQIGQAEWNLGNYQAAITAHGEAAELRRKSGDKSGVAYSLSKLASLYRESGDPAQALPLYEQVATLYAEIEDPSQEAQAYNNMGDVYYNQKDYAQAIARYHQARVILERLQLPRDLALDYYDLGDAFFQQAAYDTAMGYYRKSVEIQRSIGDEWNLIASLNSLALILSNTPAARAEGEAAYREALRLAQKLDAKNLIADCYAALARSAFRRGQLDSATTLRRGALEIYRALGDRRAEAVQLQGIGEVQVQRGQLLQALATYDEGLQIADRANRRTEMSDLLTAISWVHLLVGEYPEAITTEGRSLAIANEVRNPWGIASALNGLGNIYDGMGDYAQAIGHFQRAESIYVDLKDPLSRATPMNNIGTIYFWQGDFPRALDQFKQALTIVEDRDAGGEFHPLLEGNIGEVYYEQGAFDEAVDWLTRALAGARAVHAVRTEATALTLLGKTALARGDTAAAGRWLAGADTLVRMMGAQDRIAEVRTWQGKLAYTRGDLARARPALEEAVQIARRIGASKYLWEPLYLLGSLRRDQGDSAGALALLQEAAGVLEQLRNRVSGGEGAQKLFASGKVQGRLYEALVSLLIRQGRTEEALSVLERSMNEELRSKFNDLGIKFADPAKARLLAEEARRKAQVDGVSTQLSRELAMPDSLQNRDKIRTLRDARSIAEQEYIGFVNQMVKDQPDLKNHTRVNLRDLRATKRELPRDVALITYLPGERELYIFAVTTDTVVATVVEIPRDTLDRMVDLMVRLARNPTATFATVQRAGAAGQAPEARPEGDVRAQGRLLYDLLIRPVEREIGNRKRLAIVPSGSLYYLPFQILGQGADSAFHTLDEQRTVFYVTELKVAPARVGPRPALHLVAFGNADSTLPNAEREVLGLKRLYPTTSVYLHHDATESRAKLLPATFNVVHFATHGNLDYTDFEKSYLTLAPSPNGSDDGRLTLSEVWSLQGFDKRRMVVLSACNTAVPDEKVAGWPNSPATAFLDVGVPTVIASLWPVDDAATSELIASFYRNLRTMDTAEALRQAQLALRANPRYAHPYFWGAWVLVGDWR
jgi:CHAT domain-containing protein/Tfp pilus assembly protein PilF